MNDTSSLPLTLLPPLPQQPFIAAAVVVHVGWRHEPPALAGISHYLEHVHYLGARHYPDIDAVTARYGVQIDGPTEAETTTFAFTALREDFFALLPVLLEMAFHPRLDPKAVERERQQADVALSPSDYTPWEWVEAQADDLLFETEVLESLGTPHSMTALTLDDLKAWQRRYYHAGNSHLLIAGDADPQRLQAALAAAEVPAQGEQPQVVRRRHAQRWYYQQRPDMTNGELFAAFRFPAETDLVPYHLLSILLGNYAYGPAFQALRREGGIAYMISSSLRVLSDNGRFGFYVGLGQGVDAQKAWEHIVHVLQKMKQQPVSEATLSWAKRVFRIRLLQQASTPTQALRFRRRWGQWKQPFPGFEALAARAERVTAEEIQRLAASLFTTSRAYLAMVGPSPAPDIETWLAKMGDSLS